MEEEIFAEQIKVWQVPKVHTSLQI